MSLDGESFKLLMRAADFNNKTVTTMSESAEQEGPPSIPSYRYTMAIHEMMLLRSMEVLNNDEVKRLISQLKSPDRENWYIAEECIKQKLS